MTGYALTSVASVYVHTLFLVHYMYIFQSNVPTSQTTERNPKALDISTFDLEFEVDPLFQKTSAAFDEGGVEGLLLNHLCIRYVMPDWYSIVTRTCMFVTVPSRNWTLFCLCISIVLPQSGLLEHILSTKGDTYIYALCSCMNTWSMQTVYMGLALNGSSVLQLFEHCKVMEILSGICTCIMYRLYSLCMYLLSHTLQNLCLWILSQKLGMAYTCCTCTQ